MSSRTAVCLLNMLHLALTSTTYNHKKTILSYVRLKGLDARLDKIWFGHKEKYTPHGPRVGADPTNA